MVDYKFCNFLLHDSPSHFSLVTVDNIFTGVDLDVKGNVKSPLVVTTLVLSRSFSFVNIVSTDPAQFL